MSIWKITQTPISKFAQMPLTFWWETFHTATYLINRLPTLLSIINHPSKPYLKNNLIINFCILLAVLYIHVLLHITHTSSNFIILNVYLLDTMTITRDTPLFLLKVECIFPEMLSLTMMTFHVHPLLPQIVLIKIILFLFLQHCLS